MKKNQLILAILLLSACCFLQIQAQTTIRFVKPTATGTGNGSSWANASGNLQGMINASNTGDQVWVASGTYPLMATLTMKDGVNVYGGFLGNETSISARPKSDLDGNGTIEDWEFTHATILHGQNARQVLNQPSIFAVETTWDGVTITGGRGVNTGGGVLIKANGKLINSTVSGNSPGTMGGTYHTFGGGIYNDGGIISYCMVNGNTASTFSGSSSSAAARGAGIYNSGGTVNYCTIIDNTSSASGYYPCSVSDAAGAGIYNQGGNVNHCIVNGNIASSYINAGYNASSNAIGAGIYNSGGIVSYCTVNGNTASTSGQTSSGSVSCNSLGGGIYNNSGTISHCTVSDNVASWNYYSGSESAGGGIYCANITNSIVNDCIIENNKILHNGNVSGSGGGIYRGIINHCIIRGNSSNMGGALYQSIANNCLIVNNNADDSGGAYEGTYTNCTFVENIGGGILEGTATNCIFWKNSPYQIWNSAAVVTYSAIQGGYTGIGNINLAESNDNGGPLFVLPVAGNYQLQPCSPCVNVGNNGAVSSPATAVDLAGNPRIWQYGTSLGIVDMGAYEAQSECFIPVTSITNVPAAATATVPLTLTGSVIPSDATNKTITWSVQSAGTTGAIITGGNILNTTNSGTAIVRATVANGASPTTPFTEDFNITVNKAVLGGTVTITGNTIFGQMLTASHSLSSTPTIPNMGTISHQWRRGTTNISGATNSTYTLVQDDIGQTINVVITAENCTGTVTSANSASVTKATQSAPNAPTLLSSTATSITLNIISGCEYSRDAGNWQDSPIFSGLTPNISYSFTQQLKETATHYASLSSAAATHTTNKATLSGTVTITGNAVYGQTLTANTSGLTSNPAVDLGTLSYEWKRNNVTIIATVSTYTLVLEDIGTTITVTVTAENCSGSITSNQTATVAKIAQTAPAAPTLADKTATSITLVTVSGCEYRRDAGNWQDSPIFSGLTPNTSYSFTQRLKETATHSASPASTATSITTDKAILGGTVTITGNAVFGETLTANTTGLTTNPSGSSLGALTYQWKRNGTNIGTNSSTYTLVQADIDNTITVTVIAANCDGEVTSASTATVTKASQTAPAAPTLLSNTTTSITLVEMAGCEYRMNGGAWQNSTTFSGLTPNTSYSFTQRLKETATHFASLESLEAQFTTNEEVSITENLLEKITIYPNPTTGELQVTSYRYRGF